jgi:DNA polymerase III alpha subunit (gram-positive type)
MTETYISVDIETTGLIIGEDNIASIGACVVGNTSDSFYVELKPFTTKFRAESVQVCKLSIDYLEDNGEDIVVGLTRFYNWIKKHENPTFVGFPLAFDMGFVHQYFLKYIGTDPFGRTSAGVDIKSYAMCVFNCDCHDTTKRKLNDRIKWEGKHSHNALDDAKEQANLFSRLMEIRQL